MFLANEDNFLTAHSHTQTVPQSSTFLFEDNPNKILTSKLNAMLINTGQGPCKT